MALQALSTNVAHHINRGDCDALADYFVDDAKYEEDTQTSKGETRSLHGFVIALTPLKRLRATFIVQSMLSLSIRGSREEAVYEFHMSPGGGRTTRLWRRQ